MLKGSDLTKSMKKKWNMHPTVEQNSPSSNKPSPSSVVEQEDDVHFMIDADDFSFLKYPHDASTEVTQKAYSKKKPVIFPPFVSKIQTEVFGNNDLTKTKPKCTPDSKVNIKKRKRESDPGAKSLASRKTQKKTVSRASAQSSNAKVPRLPRGKSLGHDVKAEPDSDIEIVGEVKLDKPYNEGKPITLPVKRAVNNVNSTKKTNNKNFEPEVINDSSSGMVINEADIAPFMPTNPNQFPDVGGANSMRWLTARGQISYGSSSAENGTKPTELFLKPEEITGTDKKRRMKSELKSLYDNLNEIKWVQDSNFKSLLAEPDTVKQVGVRIAGSGKVLRKLKPVTAQTTSPTTNVPVKKNKKKVMRLKHKFRLSSASDIRRRKLVKRVAFGKDKLKSIRSPKFPLPKVSLNEETDFLYQINPNPPKEKLELPNKKLKFGTLKIKKDIPKVKTEGVKPREETKKVLKLKNETQKAKSSILKLKTDGTKPKTNVLKVKFEDSKLNSLKLKQDDEIIKKSCLALVKPEDSPPSTSSSQLNYCEVKSSTSKNCSKSSSGNDLLKKRDNNFDFTKELLRGFMGENDNTYSAVQKGSKLRVRLQPLEHTDLWTSEFYEDVRKHFLDQALRKALENRDRDSITVMYQDLLESFMSSQASNNNNRMIKKKKHEEESLRVSARQSEGAFRYKEIVVKKHPNYMQVVLVPNEVKQNSLTIEAMKELKEALLLAKKDPNCHAVLLNSSGTYFCTGVDLSPLIGSNKKQAAEDLANSIRDLVMTLGLFTKPVIAAVNGVTVGFGVSLLTYCDVVLASDKATFHLPATKLGYIPEGGVTLTLPQVVGSSVASEMFLQGRRLTAEQAFRYGLVSEVLWPTKLMNEVIPRLKTIISQPIQAMEATKAMVRCHLWDKLKSHVERERRLLCEHWLGAQCQANIKAHLQKGWIAD